MSQHSTAPIATSNWAGYDAARSGVALVDRRDRGRIVLSGADRASYLQGMLTNEIATLTAGHGCYACYLTAQGRMISDMWVFELGDTMLMTTPGSTREVVLSRLDQFIFSEDVRLGDVTETFSSIALLGPDAPRVIHAMAAEAPVEALGSLGEGGSLRTSIAGQPAIVLRTGDAGVPAYELLTARDQYDEAWRALVAQGAVPLSEDASEAIRVEAGVPRFHRDMDETIIPLEAGLERHAISLHKGCYVGQEVIIRVLHRGHGRVAKKLVGLTLNDEGGGDAKALTGSAIHAQDREVGRVTSATWSPRLRRSIALGYVHRDFVSPGTPVAIGPVQATVTTLPFVP